MRNIETGRKSVVDDGSVHDCVVYISDLIFVFG